jgi:hypothetical protein
MPNLPSAAMVGEHLFLHANLVSVFAGHMSENVFCVSQRRSNNIYVYILLCAKSSNLLI